MKANANPCGTCTNYWALECGNRKGTRKVLPKGYCLEKTIFASNKPGNPVYPPRAKTAELLNAVHKVTIVDATEVQVHCSMYKAANR